MSDNFDYPKKKSRDLSEDEKEKIRQRIIEVKEDEIGHPISKTLAEEFDCSPSQIAGIKAHM